jgi:hypothetical protein
MCGQIHAVELSEKASIGRADPRRRSRAERIGIMEIKIEKGAILSHQAEFTTIPSIECPCGGVVPLVRLVPAGIGSIGSIGS